MSSVLTERIEEWNFYPTFKNRLAFQANAPDYFGNMMEDLKRLRVDSENTLTRQYNTCDVSRPKAIRIKNEYYNREVDIVVSNWYDDVTSIINDKGIQRGIQIYNKQLHDVGDPDYPFISISRINDRGNETNGRLRRMIRFLKNVKMDSDKDIELNSFEINAICYNIPIASYQTKSYLELAQVLYFELAKVITNNTYAHSITSVNGREYVFYNIVKIPQIQLLFNELHKIYIDLPSYRAL